MTQSLAQDIEGDTWRVNALRQQIERLGAKPKGRRRAELAEQLSEAFLNPNRLRERFEKVTPEERLYYTYTITKVRLAEYWQIPIADAYHVYSFTAPEHVILQRLIDVGLFLEPELHSFYAPLEASESLPPLFVTMAAYDLPPDAQVYKEDPNTLRLKIQQLLAFLQTERAKLRPFVRWKIPFKPPYGEQEYTLPPIPADAREAQRKQPGELHLCPFKPLRAEAAPDHCTEALGVSTYEAEWLFALLLILQLVLRGSPASLDEAAVQNFLALPPGEQYFLIYKYAAQLFHWNVVEPLWRVGELSISWNYRHYWDLYRMEQPVRTFLLRFNALFFELLAILPEDQWLSLKSINEWLGKVVGGMPSKMWGLPNLNVTQVDGDWSGFLNLGLESLLRGPLYWMGLAELAMRDDELIAFRVQGLQDMQWLRVRSFPLTEDRQLSEIAFDFLHAEQEIQIAASAPVDFLNFVQRWSKPAGFTKTGMLRYHLSYENLHQEFESGTTVAELVDGWTSTVEFPLPDEIRAWWEYWDARYGHVRLYPAQTALMVRDEFTMKELQVASPLLRDSIHGIITPCVALIDPQQSDAILKQLEQKGYLPKEEA